MQMMIEMKKVEILMNLMMLMIPARPAMQQLWRKFPTIFCTGFQRWSNDNGQTTVARVSNVGQTIVVTDCNRLAPFQFRLVYITRSTD